MFFEQGRSKVVPTDRDHSPINGILFLVVQVIEESGGENGNDISQEHEAHEDTIEPFVRSKKRSRCSGGRVRDAKTSHGGNGQSSSQWNADPLGNDCCGCKLD